MAALESLVRYLELALAACCRRPALHRHQIEVYRRLLARARAAPGAPAYYRALRAQGDDLAMARAAWQDRHRNAACVHHALGDTARHRVAVQLHHAGASPDFLAGVARARRATAAADVAATAAAQALTGLLGALISYRTEAEPRARQEHLRDVRGLWARLQAHDPGCTWARVMQHPPYRHRIPFDDARLAVLGAWLAEALAGAPAGAGGPGIGKPDTQTINGPSARSTGERAVAGAAPAREGPAGARARPSRAWPDVPTAADVARAYHLAYAAQSRTMRDAMPGTARRLYEHVFTLERGAADGPALLRALEEEGLPCRLARAPHLDWAEQTARHCAGRSQPVLAHHAERLSRALLECPTVTAVEHELERLDTLLAVDSAWDDLLLHSALRAVAAVLAHARGPGDASRETVRRSYGFVCAFLGMDWDHILAVPRLWSFFARELHAACARPALPGAWRGEVGLPLIRAARDAGALAERVEARARPRMDAARVVAPAARPGRDSPEALRAHLTALLRQAVDVASVPLGPAAHREVMHWGRRVHLHELSDALRAPAYPAVDLEAADVPAR